MSAVRRLNSLGRLGGCASWAVVGVQIAVPLGPGWAQGARSRQGVLLTSYRFQMLAESAARRRYHVLAATETSDVHLAYSTAYGEHAVLVSVKMAAGWY